jgi:hypothetical protein
VIQSIPTETLRDGFPVEIFDLSRPGLYYLPMAPLLEPHAATIPLYNQRSHGHWTAFAHAISGKALADLVIRERLLRPNER